MTEQILKYDCECDACKGTGVYVGMGEMSGAAVVCSSCKGSGERHITIKYRDFTGRKDNPAVRRVYRTNPGIGIGEGNGVHLEDFGGISYDDWKADKPFPPMSEDRRFTCPAWFYQSADYKLRPDWRDDDANCSANLGGRFSDCKHFGEKHKCWARWDREFRLSRRI